MSECFDEEHKLKILRIMALRASSYMQTQTAVHKDAGLKTLWRWRRFREAPPYEHIFNIEKQESFYAKVNPRWDHSGQREWVLRPGAKAHERFGSSYH
jgi:hypothetical protein